MNLPKLVSVEEFFLNLYLQLPGDTPGVIVLGLNPGDKLLVLTFLNLSHFLLEILVIVINELGVEIYTEIRIYSKKVHHKACWITVLEQWLSLSMVIP